jgi:BirA family biotin operon repressor/biotin-[acetyl-CoA-carboxylase] ligase
MALNDVFVALARHGRASAELWPEETDPAQFGLRREGAHLVPAGQFEALDPRQIEAALSRRALAWIEALDVLPVVGSTNAELMARVPRQSVAGMVCMSEVQVQGRGRRGRNWLSPFGTNLALSLGIALERRPADLGGASLVVGLALLDALEQFDIPDLALKWPNDVLLRGQKVGGILLELAGASRTEVVIGIGLNVTLPAAARAALPETVTDLASAVTPPSRSVLAARVISSVVDFMKEFDGLGFEPFREAFDARHAYQGMDCRVLQGAGESTGRVVGVSAAGELVLDGHQGLRTFNGGEVSLRVGV